jgi:hypothetical protein
MSLFHILPLEIVNLSVDAGFYLKNLYVQTKPHIYGHGEI